MSSLASLVDLVSLVYLAALVTSIGCLLLIDRRFRLFFFDDAAAAALVCAAGVAGLLLWDGAGIASGVFVKGDSRIDTGIMLAPQLPLEEPLFLFFLVQCTLIAFTGAVRLLKGRP